MSNPGGDADSRRSIRRADPASVVSAARVSHASAPDAGLSLDKLSAVMAKMLSAGDDPYSRPVDQPLDHDERELAVDENLTHGDEATTEPSADDGCEVNPRSILESLLFVGSPSGEPITAPQVASLMRGVRPAEIDSLVRELNVQYAERRCPYHILSVGAGYRLSLRDQYAPLRDKFYGKVRQARLSQAAIEVLSVVAYHEPLTSEEINKLRGTPSGPILAQLVRRQLLRLESGEGKPRRGKYYTTDRFLQLFGLESLADLPRSQDLEQRLADQARQQAAMGDEQ